MLNTLAGGVEGNRRITFLGTFCKCEDDTNILLLCGHLAEHSPTFGNASVLQVMKQMSDGTDRVDLAQCSCFRRGCSGNVSEVPVRSVGNPIQVAIP